MISRFGEYLAERNYLLQPHGHSFYHFVLFTKGAGKQAIDFTSYSVKAGQIYFMNPGQVHNWQFSGDVDGYIVNFSENYFDSLIRETNYLARFPFFGGYGDDQVIQLNNPSQKEVKEMLESILLESKPGKGHAADMIRSLLLQLFIKVSRQIEPARLIQLSKPGFTLLRNFQKLVNEKYQELRFPSEFAGLLSVTPNYLNSISKELLGKSAGEVIRDRVILEAKRLLVNADMTINQIATRLDFEDNSYFSKFFKKYEGKTPEDFRKEHQVVLENH